MRKNKENKGERRNIITNEIKIKIFEKIKIKLFLMKIISFLVNKEEF